MAKNGHSEFFPIIFPRKTAINLEWPKMAVLKFFPINFPQKDFGINLEWPKMAVPNFFQQFFLNRLVQIWNGQKWLFSIFSNNFSQKDWYKFGMAKNGHSEFFPIIFPRTDCYQFGMAKMAVLNFFQNFPPKDWYKFGMAKNGCSKFFPTIFPKNLELVFFLNSQKD